MTTGQRKLLQNTGVMGLLLTALAVLLDQTGALTTPDRVLYDRRAKYCQYYAPAPTDTIVHLDIDDAALTAIGRWPWPRETIARMVDELSAAGPKAVAFDVLFSEPSDGDRRLRKFDDQSVAPQDLAMADALGRCNKVLLPVAFQFKEQQSKDATEDALVKLLSGNLELAPEELSERLSKLGIADSSVDTVIAHYQSSCQTAMLERLLEPRPAELTFDQLRARLLPQSLSVADSPLLRQFRNEYELAESLRTLASHGRAPTPPLPPLLEAAEVQSPIAVLARKSPCTGFVNYLPFDDGVIRAVPLWVSYRGKLYPQIGFSLACAMLDVDVNDPKQVEISPTQVVIHPPKDDPIRIPLSQITSRVYGQVSMIDVPWYGRQGWQSLYGLDERGRPKHHVSVNQVWDICVSEDAIASNNVLSDQAIHNLLLLVDQNLADEYEALKLDRNDYRTRQAWADRALAGADDQFMNKVRAHQYPPDELPQIQPGIEAYNVLTPIRRQSAELVNKLEQLKSRLKREVAGRAVLVGFTATGALDQVSTSVEPACPGVVVHSTIYNAIMTRRLLSQAPAVTGLMLTILLGLISAAFVTFFSPWTALLGVLASGLLFLGVDGLVLYDSHRIIVSAAGPVAALAIVWSGSTLFRYVLERAERARITQKFRSYVDPGLVNYLIDNPDATLAGRRREVTIVFTDLQGFTRLTEIMGEGAVGMLGEYMGEMVPIIRLFKGYVNKFIGDGIMSLFGPFYENPDHAGDALNSVFTMNSALAGFNERLKARELPELKMRAGVNTGEAIVGNAGPPDGTDYTALGDAVNLAARLESANKAIGSSILIGERTAELLHGRYLLRPVGKLRVVGKTAGIMTYEPLALAAEATEDQQVLARECGRIVDLFQQAKFAECLAEIESARKRRGESDGMLDLYAELCERYQTHCPPDFHGLIVLEEK